MTVTASTRLGITRWSAGTDPFTRAQMDASFATLDNLVAIDMQGLLSARPAAAKRGVYYWATDGTGALYRDTGTAWAPVFSVVYAAPGASAVGDLADAGTGTDVARANHRHAREAFGTVTAEASGQAASSGVATTPGRSDHTHGTPVYGGVPGAVTPGDAALTGSGALAFSNHQHSAPAFGAAVAAATTFGTAAAVGVAGTLARSDHAHGSPPLPVTTLAAAGATTVSASTGAVTITSPAYGAAIPATNPFGGAGAVGTAAAGMSYGDHVHPMATPATSVAGRTGPVVLTAADIGAGTFPGAVTFASTAQVTGVLTVRGSTAANGFIAMQPGGTTQTGYVEFISATGGVRQGYIGFAATNAANDAGTIPYIAGTHAFTGALTTTGALTENGARVYSATTPNLATTVVAETAYGQASAVGTGAAYARNDHTHGTPAADLATTVTSETTFGLAAAVGTGTSRARNDHTHGTPATPTAAQVGAVSTAGGSLVTASAIGVVPLALRPITGQTADVQQWQNAAGTAQTAVNQHGSIGSGNFALYGPGDTTQTTTATFIAAAAGKLAVKAVAFSGQTADIIQVQSAAGTVIASVPWYGGFATTGAVTAGGMAAATGSSVALGAIAVAPGNQALVARGAVGQTANIADFQNSAGTPVATVGPGGAVNAASFSSSQQMFVATASDYSASLNVRAGVVGGAAAPGIVIRGNTGQSGDYISVQNSAASILFQVQASGHVQAHAGITVSRWGTPGTLSAFQLGAVAGLLDVNFDGQPYVMPFYFRA